MVVVRVGLTGGFPILLGLLGLGLLGLGLLGLGLLRGPDPTTMLIKARKRMNETNPCCHCCMVKQKIEKNAKEMKRNVKEMKSRCHTKKLAIGDGHFVAC